MEVPSEKGRRAFFEKFEKLEARFHQPLYPSRLYGV
jgi:hypothetical protein